MTKRGWEIPEREATSEEAFLNRRRFMKSMGLASIGAIAGCSGQESIIRSTGASDDPGAGSGEGSADEPVGLYPATRNTAFSELDRPLTDETVAARFNNFWEFTNSKSSVHRLIKDFESRPWTLEVKGLVRNRKTYDIDDLVRLMPLEERLYRLRCVEAWSMAIPWTGFTMKALMDLVEPLSSARYVKMTSFLRPAQAKGQWEQPTYPWPYTEGLTIEEAANELTLLATGVYGHTLPDQHGAPIRLVVPWKYGFKSVKSIVTMEFTRQKPVTFWPSLASRDYGFFSIVNPNEPHPRWSQATERFIENDVFPQNRRPTLLYNGYGDYVAHMYSPNDLKFLA